MPAAEHGDGTPRIERERDLYLRLLQLGHQTELEPFLVEALALIVEVVGARQGYLQLHEADDDGAGARWSIAHGFGDSEVGAVRAAISSGIVAESIATGETVVTSSALTDPRFRTRESVRAARIEAVLCAPIGIDPPRGVLYLQGHEGSGEFGDEARSLVEICAEHLAPLVDRLVARQHQDGDATVPLRRKLRLDGVIGRSSALAQVLRQVAAVAPLDVGVLLTGDSGTGKSQLARVIHDNGPRAGKTFVEVNCAALPETLIESELFGAMPGAHSTAVHKMQGKVAAAERGTLFLDEVGELSLAAQAKLLQLLQSKQYYPLGAATVVEADVRVIAATNSDLRAAAAAKTFREDLLFRLEVLPMRVPSLGERQADIAELAAFFRRDACERHGFPTVELSRNAVRALESAQWPGNVRQLGNTVEAGVIRAISDGASQVERVHVFPDEAAAPVGDGAVLTFQEATRRYQAHLLQDALLETDWNVAETSRRLDLTRSHVYNLIRAFGLQRKSR